LGNRLGLLLAFLLALVVSVAGVALAHPDHDDCEGVSDREGVMDSAVEAQGAKSPCDKQHDGD
jgi:hypothetical protein